MTSKFSYGPGDYFKRSDMHEIVGGSFRHGMTSCSNGEEFLLFHDKKKSKKYGYDLWEGLQADGSFHYTGQGTQGDQVLTKSNLALLKADLKGLPIHLIETNSGRCLYLGKFLLGSPKYVEQKTLDVNQDLLRKVFVFNLLPTDISIDFDLNQHNGQRIQGLSSDWSPPNFSQVNKGSFPVGEYEIKRLEFKLQGEFGSFLISNGHSVFNYDFTLEGLGGTLKPDMWIPDLNLVVEAKPSCAREYVRLGIGQVLDYANLSTLEGTPMKPGLLLPARPTQDLVDLIKSLGIALIYKSDVSFTFINP